MLRTLHKELEHGRYLSRVLKNVSPESENGTGDVETKKRTIVEFSSPNIAKPFHVGHLRSTIIGNFISAIFKASGREVTKINYLGDWGTQFGILSEGFSRKGSWPALQGSTKSALNHLHEIYVESNTMAEDDVGFRSEALRIFRKMEDGDLESLELWKKAQSISVTEFQRIYEILDVKFDRWEKESDASKSAADLLKAAHHEGKLVESQGSQGIRSPWNDKFIMLRKRDGTTLYLTRDLSTVLSRDERIHPQQIYYVVDASQSGHFRNMKNSLTALGHEGVAEKIHHIPFGMIKGMSSRKGNAILLDEILEEGRELTMQTILKPEFTRLDDPLEIASAAQVLTNSALFIHDLKRRRRDGYKFRWEEALSLKKDTGVYLQHTFSRLSSLVANGTRQYGDIEFNQSVDSDLAKLLSEEEAQALIQCISAGEKAFQSSLIRLESSPLVNYLFKLCHHTGRAKKTLRVQGSTEQLASARLLLFDTARLILSQGISLLGLRPLSRI